MRISISANVLFNYARGSNIPAYQAIAELVDNSLDAEATTVEIEINNENIIVKDNGNGFTPETLTAAFQNISDIPYESKNKIGRHNTGMKTASIRLGDNLTILTRAVDAKEGLLLSVDWIGVCKRGEEINEPKLFNPRFSNGTEITINNLWQVKEKRDTTLLIYYLRKIYKRKINGGSFSIKVNGKYINALPDIPLLKERFIERDNFKIRYGLYDPEKMEKTEWKHDDILGVHIYYRDRLFPQLKEHRTSYFIYIPNYYIEINTFSDRFAPNTHKDGLLYIDLILSEEILQIIIENLTKDQDELSEKEEDDLLKKLEKRFNDFANKNNRSDNSGSTGSYRGQARRNPKQNINPVKPKGTDKKHKRASKGDNATINYLIGQKQLEINGIILQRIKLSNGYGDAAITNSGAAIVRLDTTTSALMRNIIREQNENALYFIITMILAKEWCKQSDVQESEQEFFFRYTRNLSL